MGYQNIIDRIFYQCLSGIFDIALDFFLKNYYKIELLYINNCGNGKNKKQPK